ncbi:MAG: phosphoribosylaminoimidazolesuccinocarboxamide synthase [Patescibacteria group bacterium]
MIPTKTIEKWIPLALKNTEVKGLGKRQSGKVRDWYSLNSIRVLVATDRISAFDRVLGLIPFRGAVLNKISEFWFQNTRDIIQNHMIGVIDPNIMLVSEVQALPVEVVVRAYITGVTDTSLWKNYQAGSRVIYGIRFPDGLSKNQKLVKPVITPTTRATGKGGHDEPITAKEIVQKGLVSQKVWKQVEDAALKIFNRGTALYAKAGLILADTKYEFGLDKKGKLILIDEVHTPDSSRLWVAKTYKQKVKAGEEPENYDKEFMRLWFAKEGYSGRGKPPLMPNDLIVKIATRYMEVFEKLTKTSFDIDLAKTPTERIKESLEKLL